VDLKWTPPGGDVRVKGYRVYDWSETQSPPSDPAGTPSGTAFAATGLDADTTYCFEVTSVDYRNEEGPAAYVSATTGPVPGESSSDGSPQVGPAPGESTGGSGGAWAIPAGLTVMAGLLALPLWRRRRRRATGVQAAPGSSVQAVKHAGPPGVVSVQTTGRGATLTVRFERHPSLGITTIEETQSP
jgi:hypothetical protein